MGLASTYGWTRGGPDWDITYNNMLASLDAALAAAGTGNAGLRWGTAAERVAYATPFEGLLWVDTDIPHRAWRYRGSGWVRINFSLDTYRHDHATRVALRPSAAYETIHTGTAGETHLVLPWACNINTAQATYAAKLSGDGGSTDHVGFNLVGGTGQVPLGAMVADSASAVLAGKSVTAANIAVGATVIKSPPGVRRLSGLSAGAMFFAVPISSSLGTIHTASGKEMVYLYIGRAPGSTSLQWCGVYGETSAGANTISIEKDLDADAVPVPLAILEINDGEVLKMGAQAASKFVAWGFARSLEV
ncbi:MAG: hypothetical protein HY794_18195 [Desulfarculus sp.]|nr:hypothetical protein [Desulfarculus sp.]